MERSLFVAREGELQRLDRFLDAALAGEGQVCFVSGEAGSGKTALVTEFARRAEELHPDLIAAFGQADAQTGIGDPYLPFREVLGLLTGDTSTRRDRTISPENANRLRKWVGVSARFLVEMAPELVGLLVPGAGVALKAATAAAEMTGWLGKTEKTKQSDADAATGESRLDQETVFEQYTRFVTSLAEETPLLLILDDLQWADPSSIALLFRLGRRIGQSRVLIVGTYRPEELALEAARARDPAVERHPAGARHPLEKVIAELKRYQGEIELSLDATDEAERRAFVDSLLDNEPNVLEEGFRAALFRHTDGQALFTVELLRAMQERGDLVHNASGEWMPGSSLDWDALPARAEGVIEERIRRLAAELRGALTVASVEGEEFTAEVVARVREEETRGLVRRLSEELQREHRLVRAQGLRQLEARRLAVYRFQHHMIQRYLYIGLDPVERAYLHEDVGNALETLYQDHTDEVAVQLAWHFEQAGVADKAATYLRQSAAKAIAAGALREGLETARRALVLLPEGSSERAGVHALLGQALYHTGDISAARGQLESAVSAARVAGEPQILAGALTFLGSIALGQGDYVQASAHLERSLALARQHSYQVGAASALRDLGWLDLRRGSYAEAEKKALESRAIYEAIGDRMGIARAADLLASVANRGYADHERALNLYREALSFVRAAGARGAEAPLLNNMAEVVRAMGDQAQAQRYYREAGALSAELGEPLGVAVASVNLGHVAAAQGDDREARAHYREVLQLAREMGDVSLLLDALAGLAGVLERAGQEEEALEVLGLVANHPALADDTRQLVEQSLATLRGQCSPEQVATGLARGRDLRLEEVVAGIAMQE